MWVIVADTVLDIRAPGRYMTRRGAERALARAVRRLEARGEPVEDFQIRRV